MTTSARGPYELYVQAGGGTPAYSQERYLELLHEHGHVIRKGEPGYEEAAGTLPCGWPGPQRPAAEWCEVMELPAYSCSH